MAVIRLKKKIEHFYTDGEEIIFVLFEDVDSNVHYYRYADCDPDKHLMHACEFYEKFTRFYE